MLPQEIMRRVREIQVRTGRTVADVLAGEYVSVFKGSGIEFDEVRPYTPGDDIRSIDWNVTARMGEPFVKRYVEERQLTLMLMADVSASQDFGSGARSKRECAAELCALLAFSAIRNDDKVGLLLFHGDIEQYIPARKGQRHALRVVREVLSHGDDEPREVSRTGGLRRWLAARTRGRLRVPRESTRIAKAVEFFLSVHKRKCVVFVVSDFIDDAFEQALHTANRKHDVVAVLVSDRRELEIDDIGLIALEDPETGARRVVDAGSRAFREAVARDGTARIEALRTRLASSGIDLIHIDAAGSVVDPLVRFFRAREKRTRR
ncbi:MAG: DUF58 domain-containing protein [Deltaproteobacteria bacterium]|jgi:uncharacterized protein (DUF58 family)|nr:DUF58 domain-containing protein [Deltaproteobacteria bacterium]MDP6075314.1 DUF58 domain-containing protein [Myxococcota bacterium]MDP7300272.1 DUF58 domain-containing protein [Myxococcota bacterium]